MSFAVNVTIFVPSAFFLLWIIIIINSIIFHPLGKIFYTVYSVRNHISGTMIDMLASSGCEPWSGQNYKIGICCFSAKLNKE